MIWGDISEGRGSDPYGHTHLVHLEGGHDGLDEHGAPDGAALHTDVILGEVEHVVPQPSLQMRFHLREVEVRSGAPLDELGRVVEEVQTEVEQAARDGLAVDGEMLLVQMPSAGAGDERGELAVGAQLVFLLALLEVDLSADGVVEVGLAVDHVVPRRCAGVWQSLASCQIKAMVVIYPQNQPYMSRH